MEIINENEVDLDPEEQAFDSEAQDWFRKTQAAKSRQNTVHSSLPIIDQSSFRSMEIQREKQAAKDAAINPASLTGEVVADPFALPTSVKASVPARADLPVLNPSSAPGRSESPPKTVQSDICFWASTVTPIFEDNSGSYTGASVKLVYASWDELKGKLKTYPGNWQATEHRFKDIPANILGFFLPEQHPAPENSVQRTFEIIVSNGKVFKAENE